MKSAVKEITTRDPGRETPTRRIKTRQAANKAFGDNPQAGGAGHTKVGPAAEVHRIVKSKKHSAMEKYQKIRSLFGSRSYEDRKFMRNIVKIYRLHEEAEDHV